MSRKVYASHMRALRPTACSPEPRRSIWYRARSTSCKHTCASRHAEALPGRQQEPGGMRQARPIRLPQRGPAPRQRRARRRRQAHRMRHRGARRRGAYGRYGRLCCGCGDEARERHKQVAERRGRAAGARLAALMRHLSSGLQLKA